MTALTDDHNNDSKSSDPSLTSTGISNSTLLPIGDSIDTENQRTIKIIACKTIINIWPLFDEMITFFVAIRQVYINDSKTQCLTFKLILVFIFALIFSLISILTISCFCGHKLQEINQKLFNNKLITRSSNGTEGEGYEKSEYKTYERMNDITI